MTKHVYIIAEAGVNHNGSLARALELVECAADAGADAVKFQTFTGASLATKVAPKADYQVKTTSDQESQQAMLSRLELSHDDHYALKKRCTDRGITFLSSAFDLASADFLISMKLPYMKVPSGEITNVPYLRRLASANVPVILSTGMATLAEIEFAIAELERAGLDRRDLVILHCNTEYPTPMIDVNLLAMVSLRTTFGTKIGYSDHTTGTEIPIAAVALGANLIEKHFTLDRNLPGPDHKASLEPRELKAMVTAIRNVEQAMGDGIKRPTASESKNRAIARKSIVAAKPIAAGEKFSDVNVTSKRPGTGLSPAHWDAVIGQTARRAFAEDEMIQL